MAFCRLTFSLLVLSVVQILGIQVPVYLWGDLPKSSAKSNPLSTVSSKDFVDILKTELKDDPFTVIFVEETLSVEDFSLRNSDGDSSYPYLHSIIGKSLYLPAVEDPLNKLKVLADPDEVDHVKLTENGLSAKIESKNGKFLFINFKDAKEGDTRADLLRRHNNFMEDMMSNLRERYSNVVAIYTAHYPSWTVTHSRVRRQAEGGESGLHHLDGLLLYVQRVTIFDRSNGNLFNLTNLINSSSVFNTSVMDTQLTYSNADLVLHFRKSGGYWFFETVTLNQVNSVPLGDTLNARTEVYALDDFSYRCADNITFSTLNNTHSYSINFLDMKIQPFFETRNSSSMVFGDSFNCVGFFSVPIWSGLFVVFILLAITFYGIMMMMDIRTMDRFDDPKGKTITINAGE